MIHIVFFGTPDYVLPVLEKLHKKFKTDKVVSPIVAVITQSPKPAGRDRRITYSPIDKWAHERKIPIYYKAEDLVKDGIKADLGILAAYGEIISNNVIGLFPKGILNIHPSDLPKYRGASPIPATIVSGEKQVGVSIIKLDSKMDHGPVVSRFYEDIAPDDTTESLKSRLFSRGADVLVELIEAYCKGKITPKIQDDEKATFTTLLKKEHGLVPPKYLKSAMTGESLVNEKWEIPFVKNLSITPDAVNLDLFIRAMYAWPCAWSYINLGYSKRLKILKAHLEDNKLVLDSVQLEGKETVTWKQFVEGYPQASF